MTDQQTDDPDVRTYVDAVAWSPDGRFLALAAGDYWGEEPGNNWVWVVEMTTQRVTFRTTHDAGVAKLAWSPTSDALLIGSANGKIQRYNVITGSQEAMLPWRPFPTWRSFEAMSLSSDGTRLAGLFGRSRGPQGITIYDAETLEILTETDANFSAQDDNRLEWIGYSPDGKMLATTGWDGVVRLWNADRLSQVAELTTSPGKRLYAGAWHPDGRLAVGGMDHHITILNVSTREIVKSLGVKAWILTLKWHPDGRQMAVMRGTSVWDTITGQKTHTLTSTQIPALAMDWNRSGILVQGIDYPNHLHYDPETNPLGVLTTSIAVPSLPPE